MTFPEFGFWGSCQVSIRFTFTSSKRKAMTAVKASLVNPQCHQRLPRQYPIWTFSVFSFSSITETGTDRFADFFWNNGPLVKVWFSYSKSQLSRTRLVMSMLLCVGHLKNSVTFSSLVQLWKIAERSSAVTFLKSVVLSQWFLFLDAPYISPPSRINSAVFVSSSIP